MSQIWSDQAYILHYLNFSHYHLFSDGEGPISDHNAWVEEIEEKPEINEFGHITPPIVPQSHQHRHPQQPQDTQQQQTQQQHQQQQQLQHQGQQQGPQQQQQNQQFSAAWYPSYIYSQNIQPISNRDTFPNSLITYSENNNVVGIS